MTDETRDRRLLQTFAGLADTLTADYDVVDLLQILVDACADLLDASAAGILLADGAGELALVASTSEATHLVEMMQLGARSGPCIDSYLNGTTVSVPVIAEGPVEWSAFKKSALAQGFAAADAIPLRLRDTTIGTLNLLREAEGPSAADDLVAARAFADVATIGILHERSFRESQLLTQQLQQALNSRVVIEQAKGVVSYTAGVSVDAAFALIRRFARSHAMTLSEVSRQLVARELRLDRSTA